MLRADSSRRNGALRRRGTGSRSRGRSWPPARSATPRTRPTRPLPQPVRDRDRGRHVARRSSAGDHDPHGPPPRRTRSDRAPLRLSHRVSSRATLAITPIPASVTTSAVPPKQERERHAGDRQQSRHGAEVHEGLQPDPARDPGREEAAERIGCVDGDPDTRVEQQPEQGEDRERADQPELLAQHGEHEVAVGVGQVVPLRRLFPSPTPSHPPDPSAIRPCRSCQPAPLGSSSQFSHASRNRVRRYAVPKMKYAIAARPPREVTKRAEADAGREEHQEHAPADDQRGPEVPLEHHRTGDEGDDRCERKEEVPRPVEALPRARQDRRRRADRQQLRELGRLQRHRPQVDPPGRSVQGRAHAGVEREQQQRDQCEQERERRPTPERGDPRDHHETQEPYGTRIPRRPRSTRRKGSSRARSR